jgi:hypothetical protein
MVYHLPVIPGMISERGIALTLAEAARRYRVPLQSIAGAVTGGRLARAGMWQHRALVWSADVAAYIVKRRHTHAYHWSALVCRAYAAAGLGTPPDAVLG